MPFNKDPGRRESDRYCNYCFKNGKLCFEGPDLKEFQRGRYESMVAQSWRIFSPTWSDLPPLEIQITFWGSLY
ncbi:MAG: hypothetical protein IPP68_03725 [Elusimicrobia bacterium]|nr:hypothetical protein [Elusimicrobiota bacterium]